MESRRRRFLMRHPVVVGIGCSCRKVKLSSFLTPRLKSRAPISPSSATATTTTTSSSSSRWETSATDNTTTTTISSSSPSLALSAAESPKRKGPKKAAKGVAVVKESSDPYHDFRDSMVQMIVEMEIYAWDDLRDLLLRFLALNSPYHHHLILQAFAEICAPEVTTFSPSSSSAYRSGFHR